MYPIIIFGLFVGIIILFIILRQRKLTKKLKQLRDNWAKIPEKKLDIESIKLFFKFNKNNSIKHSYCIDNDTWDDLDFDQIFQIINRTITPIGSQYLFYLLRHPVFKKEILENRERLINNFTENKNLREKIQLAFQKLEDDNVKNLVYSLWKPLPDIPGYTKILQFISFTSLSVLLLVLTGYIDFLILLPIFTLNLILRSLIKRKIDIDIQYLKYLGNLINVADKILSLKFKELIDIQSILNKNLEKTRIIGKEIFTLQANDDFGVYEYIKIYFLWDISRFYSVIDKIKNHLKELRAIYETIGNLDALISTASFRANYNDYCCPMFNGVNGKYIVKDIYHPLLNKSVPNSFEFKSKNIIITGSNMAGKTTFLKTLGVNAILSQTINTSLAKSYKAPFIKVISSIGKTDDLVSGKSYYLAEVESILRLIKASELEVIHLFIMDEIFRGTNSTERLATSVEVLKYLSNNKDYILVATHDLQLSEIVNSEYSIFNFREEVCEEGLKFDYKLHSGPSTTRNAIALLDYAGYPKSIIENATNRIRNYSI